MMPLLEVKNLHVSYSARSGEVCPALAGVNFDLGPGEILGVLGESGSGKSTLAAALLRLLPSNGKIQKGLVLFEGKNLLEVSPQDLRRIRGGRIGLIFQEPSSSLHPTLQIGQQVSDVLAAHEYLARRALNEKTSQLLASVFPVDAERISRSYPHELSGGHRQRVLIAQAIACGPSLVVADEPTASLDPTTQKEILQLFGTLRQKLGLAMILITHNPALLAGLADRILVLYAGRVAEIGPAAKVLSSPQHPYTAALLRCLPTDFAEGQSARKTRLPVIPGEPPNLALFDRGCQFEPRCTERMEVCQCDEPAVNAVGELHEVSCFKFAG
ncbi:MAG TPA: ABC transporter ATP-binding protein [Candidatus Acidoferrum sp.]|jgi:oligopeptide/dipeptide ABC transporter ATP-binding protein|nr:ABC transporter ATP-binding protein [Candidatus Acidoferrum sp.]